MLRGKPVKRRNFIITLGATVALAPSSLYAQPSPPLLAFLSSRSAADSAQHVAAFLPGLKAVGYAEGPNIGIEYRGAEGPYDRWRGLASELIALNPAVIVAAGGTGSARAAKSAPASIPILFITASSVEAGLVAGLNRPGGNVS